MPKEEKEADTHRCTRACRTSMVIRILTGLINLAVTAWNCTN